MNKGVTCMVCVCSAFYDPATVSAAYFRRRANRTDTNVSKQGISLTNKEKSHTFEGYIPTWPLASRFAWTFCPEIFQEIQNVSAKRASGLYQPRLCKISLLTASSKEWKCCLAHRPKNKNTGLPLLWRCEVRAKRCNKASHRQTCWSPSVLLLLCYCAR